MSPRPRRILLLASVAAILPGQSLPWYLADHYPASSATGVPTNTSIELAEPRTLIEGAIPYGGIGYSLISQAGTTAALGDAAVYYTNISVTPTAPLAPFTRYTFTVTPPANFGDPYSFDFTTGAGPDTTGPQLIGFSPPSGTTGVGTSGPFTALFNKRLGISSLSGPGISVHLPGGYILQQTAISWTPDGKGLMIQPLPQANGGTYWPPSYQITVDPTKIQDASGNSGQGIPQTAQYLTFAASETSGPALKSFFPADHDTGVPLNVSIRLLFSRMIDSSTAAAGITLDTDGKSPPVQFNSFANGYGVEIRSPNLLAAHRGYRVSVNAALVDQAGLAAQPAGFQFTTGSAADVTPAQAVAYDPTYDTRVLPLNALIALRANKRIMPLAAVEYSTLGSPQISGGGQGAAGPASISSDGLTFRFAPPAPPPGQPVNVSLADVVDVTGAAFTAGNVSYLPGPAADHHSPSVLAVTPPDGTKALATTAPVQVDFSKPISIALSGDFPRLSAKGKRVPSTVRFDGTLMTLLSPSPLQPNTAYTLDLGGATDQEGNAMGPFSVAFTTSAGQATGAINLLKTSPSTNAIGVNVNSSISFTFDSPLGPLSAISGFTVSDSTFGVYPAAARVTGATLTITPSHPLLHDSVISARVNTRDVNGRYAFGQILFRTGTNEDRSPFRVTGVSPPDRSTITGADRGITLTFSKAVNPASLTSSAITVYSNGQLVQSTVARANQDRSLVVTPSIDSGNATLVVDPELTDLAGNAATPFRASYTFSAATQAYPINLLALRPPSGSTGVPADTAITLFFSKAIDLAALRASLVVVADGQPTAGTFESSADGATVTFRPSSAFAAGAEVRFFQRTFVFDDNYGVTFTIAPAPAATLSVVRYTPGFGGPANGVIEVEFSMEVATGQSLVALQYSGSANSGTVVPTKESHPRPHVLRLTPVSPLAPGYYVLIVSPKAGGGVFTLQMNAAVTSPSPVMLPGPVPNAKGVPTNASVRAAFNVPLNPLSVVADYLTIQAGGRTLPSLIYLSSDSLSLVLTPTEALPANSTVKVAMSGLEDRFGNRVAAKSWSFNTAGVPDFSAPALLESNIPGTTNQAPEISPNTPAVFQFDRPLDPQIVTAGPNQRLNPQTNVVFTLSSDLRTITITPTPSWARGQGYMLYLPTIQDLAGNSLNNGAYYSFRVAFDPDRTPPRLLAVSPNGQTGLPLNTNIIATFDKPVASNSFGRIRMTQGGANVPLVVLQDDLRRARLAPATPLQPKTTYFLTVEGVADVSGNVMAGAVTHSFTTGTFMEDVAPVALAYAGDYYAAGTNAPIRVIFSAPVSPATVDSQSISINKASAIASSYSWIRIPSTTVLSADRLSVTVTPRDPLIPGWPYQVVVGSVRDFAGNLVISSNGPAPTFYEGYSPDTTPPVAIVIPTDGSTGVPVNTRLGVTFSKAIYPKAASSIFNLTSNGKPVSGTFTQSGALILFIPDFPLTPGATYRIDISSVTDFAGNVSKPVSSTFIMANSAMPDQVALQLVSSSPANGDVGVPVNSPIVMKFSNLVDPTTLWTIEIFSTFPANGSFSTSGSTVTFTPAEPWPSASTVSLFFANRFNYTVQDVAGNSLYANGLLFTTAATPDPTPPKLLSVAPPGGTLLPPPNVTFQMAFSKTVLAGPGGLVVFSGNQQTAPNITYSPSDTHTLLVAANVPASSQLTLIGNDAIVDRAGNSLSPFSFQYPTSSADLNAPPAITSVTPNSGATVTPQTPIVVTFNKAMDPKSLSNSVRVTEDGANITGALELLSSNTGVQFTPHNPYKAGSRIDVFVLETAADLSGLTLGLRYDAYFFVASASTSLAVEQTGFGSALDPNAILELLFDRALDPKTVSPENVWLRVGRKLLRAEVSLRTDRILRVVPSAPMESSLEHVLTVGPGLRGSDGATMRPEEFQFIVQPDAPPTDIAAVEWSELSGKAAVLVRFSAAVSPLSLDSVRLVAGDGADISVRRQISLDGRAMWLIPEDGAMGYSVNPMEQAKPSLRVLLNEVMRDGAGRRIPAGTYSPQSPGKRL